MKRNNSTERHLNTFCNDSIGGIRRQLGIAVARWRQLQKKTSAAATLLLFVFFIFISTVGFIIWPVKALSIFSGANASIFSTSKAVKAPLKCTRSTSLTQTCPLNDYPINHTATDQRHSSCPSYFKWIHEDLRPWKETGITRNMVERARGPANFRLVILNGRVYIEKYRTSLYTRDIFTLWGILQLLRWYPGRVPDLDLMFNCDDRPVIRARDFQPPKPPPPPLFKYCGDAESLDIMFPDWSYWGWAETNIKPWRQVLKDIKEGNERTDWIDRVPYAYWRGNPNVCSTRQDLLKCNVSDKYDWNTRIFIQDWNQQARVGYNQSSLANQCTYRYKIYIEGWAWSVSEKYILACDSMTLLVTPKYYDFFTRGLVALQNYWPIRDKGKCSSLKFAVEWANNHTDQARAIGKAGSQYVHKDMEMEYIYDYMLHCLTEYAKLLRYKPTVPPGAVELCPEAIACNALGTFKELMLESMVKSPTDSVPCTLPPPYEPSELQAFNELKAQNTRKVEMWENEYWKEITGEQQLKLHN